MLETTSKYSINCLLTEKEAPPYEEGTLDIKELHLDEGRSPQFYCNNRWYRKDNFSTKVIKYIQNADLKSKEYNHYKLTNLVLVFERHMIVGVIDNNPVMKPKPKEPIDQSIYNNLTNYGKY